MSDFRYKQMREQLRLAETEVRQYEALIVKLGDRLALADSAITYAESLLSEEGVTKYLTAYNAFFGMRDAIEAYRAAGTE